MTRVTLINTGSLLFWKVWVWYWWTTNNTIQCNRDWRANLLQRDYGGPWHLPHKKICLSLKTEWEWRQWGCSRSRQHRLFQDFEHFTRPRSHSISCGPRQASQPASQPLSRPLNFNTKPHSSRNKLETKLIPMLNYSSGVTAIIINVLSLHSKIWIIIS